jgi:hypothetical protein
MREVSAQTSELIRSAADRTGGGFQRHWVADLMYDGDRRVKDLLIAEPELAWDASSFVVGSGSARVVWADDHGSSMIPRQVGDWFSPFGSELQIDCMVGAGVFTERVPVARFVIEEVPDAVEASLLFQGALVHPGESFRVTLRDRLMRVARDRFALPKGPGSSSAWQEVQAITGLPVVRNVPDASVPGSVAYDGAKQDALKQLFDLLGAWPHVDAAGALTARPKAWSAPVDELRGVVSAPISMSADQTYNTVVVQGKTADGDPIVAVESVEEGFLRTKNPDGSVSPFGAKPYVYPDNLGVLDTYEKCSRYARELLQRVSQLRGVTREVVEPFNPLREVGDVLTSKFGLVRIQRVRHNGATTELRVEVQDA